MVLKIAENNQKKGVEKMTRYRSTNSR
uniref:Uncharacterized protein n=1 Tax=Anguilla anguilla TaxID=7936 RepID=A0A0E9Q2T5_ANGAN